MFRKLITVVLLLMLMVSPVALAGEKADAASLAGHWMDTWSQRAQMDISFEDGLCTADITWSNSASEYTEWIIQGIFQNGVLESDNTIKLLHTYSADGSEVQTIHYENGESKLTLENGLISWEDQEHMGENCLFEKVPLSNSPLEESSSELTLTGLLLMIGTWLVQHYLIAS